MAELSATNLWIGLNSLNQDGFYWTDGKPRQYTNWGYSVSTKKHPHWFCYLSNCKKMESSSKINEIY